MKQTTYGVTVFVKRVEFGSIFVSFLQKNNQIYRKATKI